jgi:hypothetical protein
VLERCGAPVDVHLMAARLDPAILDRLETPVPLFFALDFVERAARAEGIEALGLVAADHLNALRDFGAFSASLAGVPSAAAYLAAGARLVPRLTSGARYALRRSGNGLRLHIAQQRRLGHAGAHAELYAVLTTIRTLEWFVGRPSRPGSLRVPPWCRIGSEGRDRLGSTASCPTATTSRSRWPPGFYRWQLPRPGGTKSRGRSSTTILRTSPAASPRCWMSPAKTATSPWRLPPRPPV